MISKELNAEARELNIDQLENVSGGFLWIPVVVVSFLVGTAIREGIDKITGN